MADNDQLLQLLVSSSDDSVIEDTKNLLYENLINSTSSSLVQALVDRYLLTRSTNCFDVLIGVREPHDKHFLDKISDHLKGSNRLTTLELLGHVVRKQPSWIYKLGNHSAMSNFLKLLKNDTDPVLLNTGLYILATLLPIIAGAIGPHIPEIFEIFCRVCSFITKNPGKVSDGNLIYLKVALYALFHRLYGMYPCHFLASMRIYISNRENIQGFNDIIKSMLAQVRVHPSLFSSTKEAELATSRWRRMEHHDIVAECSRVSLDVNEGARESLLLSNTRRHAQLTSSFVLPGHSGSEAAEPGMLDVYRTFGDEPPVWSPAETCGMNSPPLSRGKTSSSETKSFRTRSKPHRLFSPPRDGSSATSPSGSGSVSKPSTPASVTPSPVPFKTVVGTQYSSPESSAALENSPLERRNSTSCITKGIHHLPAAKGLTPSLTQVTDGSTSYPHYSLPCSPQKKESSAFGFPDTSRNWQLDGKVSQTCQTSSTPVKEGSSALPSTVPDGTQLERPPRCKSDESTTRDVSAIMTDSNLHETLQHQESSDVDQVSVALDRSDSVVNDESGSLQHFVDYPDDDDLGCASIQSPQGIAELVRGISRLRYLSQCVASSPPSIQRSRSCPEISQEGTFQSSGRPLSLQPVQVETVSNQQTVVQTTTTISSSTSIRTTNISQLATSSNYASFEQALAELLKAESNNLPYYQLMVSAVASLYPQVCPQCRRPEESAVASAQAAGDGIDLNAEANGSSTLPAWTRLSPAEVLDRHILLAHEVHSRELTIQEKPQVSSPTIDPQTVRSQLYMMHNQLIYERHRSATHAERNRRLLGRIKEGRALEERSNAMRDQLQLQETELKQLENLVGKLTANIIQDKEDRRVAELHSATHMRETVCQNELLVAENRELLAVVKELKLKDQISTKTIYKLESELGDSLRQLKELHIERSENQRLQAEVDHLNQALVLMDEVLERYKSIASQRATRQVEVEQLKFNESSRRELSSLKHELEHRLRQLDVARRKITELETESRNKDANIKKVKAELEDEKRSSACQIQAAKDRVTSMEFIEALREQRVIEQQCQQEISAFKTRSRHTSASDVIQRKAAATGSTRTRSDNIPVTGGNTQQHHESQVEEIKGPEELPGQYTRHLAASPAEDASLMSASLSTALQQQSRQQRPSITLSQPILRTSVDEIKDLSELAKETDVRDQT